MSKKQKKEEIDAKASEAGEGQQEKTPVSDLKQNSWKEDDEVPFPDDENSEVIKLQPGESVEGFLNEIVPSVKWKGRNIYKIQEKNNDIIKVVLGTTQLDRQMSTKSIGDLVRIKRMADKPTDKGNPLQMYKTYSQKVD